MRSHYQRITSATSQNDLALAVDAAVEYFMDQFLDGLNDLKPQPGTLIWDIAKRLPGLMAYRYGQSMELIGIADHLGMRVNKMVNERARAYQDKQARSATDRVAKEMAEVEDDVIFIRELVIEINVVLGKIQGLTKALEAMNFQLSNLTKLRIAGIEDATI